MKKTREGFQQYSRNQAKFYKNYEECIKCLKIKENESIQIGMKTSIAKFTECEMLRHDKIYRRIEPDSRGS